MDSSTSQTPTNDVQDRSLTPAASNSTGSATAASSSTTAVVHAPVTSFPGIPHPLHRGFVVRIIVTPIVRAEMGTLPRVPLATTNDTVPVLLRINATFHAATVTAVHTATRAGS